jgi:sterol desaturase/sphingolipid hydroxylase (fatty acid hydroxylase superfamily)
LSFGPLDRVFISPATHQIHHGVHRSMHDRNFGNLLAVWDLCCGTLLLPDRGVGRVGLGGEEEAYRGIWRPLVIPFVGAARSCAAPFTRKRR